ncbi:hypothetical protein D3C80_1799710 [compost metagenome]
MPAERKTAIVEQHHYVLDWYEITKEELDLTRSLYTFDHRGGDDWYLLGKRLVGDEWKEIRWPRRGYFNLSHPARALADLDNRVVGFSTNSSGSFQKALAKLMERAEHLRAEDKRRAS